MATRARRMTTEDNPERELDVVASLAAAARVLKIYNPQMLKTRWKLHKICIVLLHLNPKSKMCEFLP